MIKIKPMFSGWQETTREMALDYARHKYKSIQTKVGSELVNYINQKVISGVSFSEKELKGQ